MNMEDYLFYPPIAQLRALVADGAIGAPAGVHMMILGTIYPIGAVAQGAIADRVGLRVTTAVTAVALGAIVLLVRTLRPGFDRHLEDQLAPGALGVKPEYDEDFGGPEHVDEEPERELRDDVGA